MEDCYDMVLTEADLLKEPTPRLFATMIPSHPGGTVVKSCKSMVGFSSGQDRYQD